MNAVIRIAVTICGIMLAACSSGGPDDSSEVSSANLDAIPAEAFAPADLSAACPAPFDGAGPRAGANTGFNAAGQSRSFQLIVPPASFTGPRPILFAYHGTSENGARFIARAKLADFVARGFVVVAPDAAANGVIWPVWDAMRPPSSAASANPDVELFDRLLSCTAAHYSIDKNRVYATGHSAGGIFTNRLLRSRSRVLAGGIIASGVFDLTGSNESIDPLLALVTWGGDNDGYTGTTPSGVHVPAFSFVEQASLASKFYDSQSGVQQANCRGQNLGHAWLPLNSWFIDVLLSRPKGSPGSLALPPLPGGAPARCTTDPFELPPLPDMVCASSPRAGCTEACQLFADCAVENRTVGPSFATELRKIGFTTTSCGGCVQHCQSVPVTDADDRVLSCFEQSKSGAMCGPGLEGAMPMFQTVNECCQNGSDSRFCVELCTVINGNPAAKAFFPACRQVIP